MVLISSSDSSVPLCAGELRRWKRGCYTLIHDAQSDEFALDLLLFCGCEGWFAFIFISGVWVRQARNCTRQVFPWCGARGQQSEVSVFYRMHLLNIEKGAGVGAGGIA